MPDRQREAEKVHSQMKSYSLDYSTLPSRDLLLQSRFGPDLPQIEQGQWDQQNVSGQLRHPFANVSNGFSPLHSMSNGKASQSQKQSPLQCQVQHRAFPISMESGLSERNWGSPSFAAHPNRLQTEPARTDPAQFLRFENLNYLDNDAKQYGIPALKLATAPAETHNSSVDLESLSVPFDFRKNSSSDAGFNLFLEQAFTKRPKEDLNTTAENSNCWDALEPSRKISRTLANPELCLSGFSKPSLGKMNSEIGLLGLKDSIGPHRLGSGVSIASEATLSQSKGVPPAGVYQTPSIGDPIRNSPDSAMDTAKIVANTGGLTTKLSASGSAAATQMDDSCKNKTQRKTEQNRQAQARFRQKRKEKYSEQAQIIQEMSAKLEAALMEKKHHQQLAETLEKRLGSAQRLIDSRHELSQPQNREQGGTDLEGLVNACWDMYAVLQQGGCKMKYNRQDLVEMVNGMLVWGSPALGFLRRELTEQLTECLKQKIEQKSVTGHFWLCELIESYDRMIQRARKCHVAAYTAFMTLHLPEQRSGTPDVNVWRKVLDKGDLENGQKAQLGGAHKSLMARLDILDQQRVALAQRLQQSSFNLVERPLLTFVMQGDKNLEAHSALHKEESAALFSFMDVFRLIIEPEQYAKLLVAAFPYALDTLALCNLIAMETADS